MESTIDQPACGARRLYEEFNRLFREGSSSSVKLFLLCEFVFFFEVVKRKGVCVCFAPSCPFTKEVLRFFLKCYYLFLKFERNLFKKRVIVCVIHPPFLGIYIYIYL